MGTQVDKNTYTLAKLKKFLAALSPEQLKQPVRIAFEDCPVQDLWGHMIEKSGIWANVDDSEDCGTLKELKVIHEKEFDKSNYRLTVPKGTIYLY